MRAQKKVGMRARRFHDLRHTFGSLAIQQFDVVAVKNMMGHSRLTTTERYLHSKPRPGDAAKLTNVFAASTNLDLKGENLAARTSALSDEQEEPPPARRHAP